MQHDVGVFDRDINFSFEIWEENRYEMDYWISLCSGCDNRSRNIHRGRCGHYRSKIPDGLMNGQDYYNWDKKEHGRNEEGSQRGHVQDGRIPVKKDAGKRADQPGRTGKNQDFKY